MADMSGLVGQEPTRVTVIGCGFMGQHYIRSLQELRGELPTEVAVVDPICAGGVDNTLEDLQMPRFSSLAEVPEKWFGPEPSAREANFIIAVPPGAHLQVLQELRQIAQAAGVRVRVLCEKPLVEGEQADEMLKLINPHRSNLEVRVGFVCNASPVYRHLIERLREKRAGIQKISTWWGKDRRKDPRETNGWPQDEAPHPIAAVFGICHQLGLTVPKHIRMRSKQEPFANPTAQAAARQQGRNVPDAPISWARVTLEASQRLKGERRGVPIEVAGTYVAKKPDVKSRWVRVVWREDQGEGPAHDTLVIFDYDGRDYFIDRSPDGVVDQHVSDANKLSEMLSAFLRQEEQHVALLPAGRAILPVRLTRNMRSR